MNSIKIKFAAVALCTASIFSSVNSQAETLRLAHIAPPSHVMQQVAERFATNLQKESAERFSTKISPLAKLGREPQLIKLLQSGGIQFAMLTTGELSNRSQPLQAWFLPYIFDDVAHAGAMARSEAGREMLDALDSQGMIGLGYVFAGMRHILSVDPITSPTDLQNKKIRSFPNQIFSDWWQATGAAPTAMPLSEVSPSLTTNLLDAVDIDLDAIVGLKLYQQAENLSLTNHMAFPIVMVASKKWWDRLSDSDREIIIKTFDEAEAWGIQQQVASEDRYFQTLKDSGVNIELVDKKPFQTVGEEVVNQYAEGAPLIQTFIEQAALLNK